VRDSTFPTCLVEGVFFSICAHELFSVSGWDSLVSVLSRHGVGGWVNYARSHYHEFVILS
jgi:hypothetical protein